MTLVEYYVLELMEYLMSQLNMFFHLIKKLSSCETVQSVMENRYQNSFLNKYSFDYLSYNIKIEMKKFWLFQIKQFS